MKKYVKASKQDEMLDYIDLSLSNINTAMDLSINNMGQYLRDAENHIDDFDIVDRCLEDIEAELRKLSSSINSIHHKINKQIEDYM